MIIQPIWARDSVPTRRGWMRGTELLKAQQITQEQLDEYNAFHYPEESITEPVEEIAEVEEETPTEEVEETPEEETPSEEVEETPEEAEVVEETADETPSDEAEEPVEEAEETETLTEETEVSTPTLLTEAPVSGKNLEDMNEADLANVIPPKETKKNKNKRGRSND